MPPCPRIDVLAWGLNVLNICGKALPPSISTTQPLAFTDLDGTNRFVQMTFTERHRS